MLTPGSLRARAVYDNNLFDPRYARRDPETRKRSEYGKLIDEFMASGKTHCCIVARNLHEMYTIRKSLAMMIAVEAWPLIASMRSADMTVHVQREA